LTISGIRNSFLRDSGIDDATIKSMVANEKLTQRATSASGRADEYDSLADRAAELERQMNGVDGKPGAAAYQKWYSRELRRHRKTQGRRDPL
jgi:hypothetical protein